MKSVDDHVASWQKQRQEALTTSYYELRVHVYQASDLPPADDDGSLDPYLKIKFADQKANWKRRYIPNTRDPVWYVVFDHSISNSLLIRNKTTRIFDYQHQRSNTGTAQRSSRTCFFHLVSTCHALQSQFGTMTRSHRTTRSDTFGSVLVMIV